MRKKSFYELSLKGVPGRNPKMKFRSIFFVLAAALSIIGCATHLREGGYVRLEIMSLDLSNDKPDPATQIGHFKVKLRAVNLYNRGIEITPWRLFKPLFDARYTDESGREWALQPWYLKPDLGFEDIHYRALALGPQQTNDFIWTLRYYDHPIKLVNESLIPMTNRPARPSRVTYQIRQCYECNYNETHGIIRIMGDGALVIN